jgi:hypothetical protein
MPPLAVDLARGFRPSLAGFQRKALVGRADDGTWQLPVGNAPSTWILKPDGPHGTAANEATCLRLAAACGLEVPDTELLDLDGLAVLAVNRYDRRPSPDGPVRVHQEDGSPTTQGARSGRTRTSASALAGRPTSGTWPPPTSSRKQSPGASAATPQLPGDPARRLSRSTKSQAVPHCETSPLCSRISAIPPT